MKHLLLIPSKGPLQIFNPQRILRSIIERTIQRNHFLITWPITSFVLNIPHGYMAGRDVGTLDQRE
jgi:hypothetical protein